MASGYDTYKNALSQMGSSYKNTYSNPYAQSGDLTQSQQEIQAYAEDIKANEKPKIKPLQWIFDRLQTGQYVSANIVDQTLSNLDKGDPIWQDIGAAIKEGFSGERKGSYKDVLTKHTPLEDRKGELDWVDALGFLGDVFLDPLTYITIPVGLTSGATKMGVQGATKFGDDVAKVALKTLGDDFAKGNIDGIMKFMKPGKKGFSVDIMKSKMDESVEAATKYFEKHAGGDVAKTINEIKTTAYKKALHTPAEELRKDMLSRTQGLMENQASKRSDAITSFVMGNTKPEQLAVLQQPSSMIEDLVSAIPSAYGGAGERKFGTFMGHEFRKSVRPLNPMEKMGTAISSGLSKTAGKYGLKDAWWTAMNRGPIGEIRSKLGFKDPYGKMVNLEYMDSGKHYGEAMLREETMNARNVFSSADKEIQDKWVKTVILAEEISKGKNKITALDVINDPVHRHTLGILDEELPVIEAFGQKYSTWIRKTRADYMRLVEMGVADNMGDIKNYLPMSVKSPSVKTAKIFNELGTSAPGFSKTKIFSTEQTINQQIGKYKAIYGVDENTARRMIKDMNLSEVNMNLEQLMTTRAYAMAQLKKRGNVINSFREFGVPISEVKGEFGEGLTRHGGRISEMGLSESGEKGLEGLYFDKEVLDVFNRVTNATSPPNIGFWQKALLNYNSWWKGMATMTTGFHARNFLSNNITGVMVHGRKWLDPKKDFESFSAAIYAGKAIDPTKAIKEAGLTKSMYNKALNTMYGDYSVRELADMQIKKGLLSEAQMGFDPRAAFQSKSKLGAINPMSQDFVGRSASRKLGGWIENQAKFKSFLIDYDELYKEAGKLAPDVAKASQEQALLTAERTAKKWWLDYSDLSEYEQKVMKNIMPFYTWMRKNIGNQIEGLFLYPQTFSIFPKVQDALEYEDPNFDTNDIPDWMKDLGMFPTSIGFGEQKSLFRPDMPFMDLNKLPLFFEEGRLLPKYDIKELKDDVVNSMHPFMKSFASAMTDKGYDFFRKKDLEGDAPAPEFLRFLTKNVDTLGYLDGLLRWTGVEGFKPRVDENGKLRVNARWLQFFENNLPIIRNINLVVQTAQGVPELVKAVDSAAEKDTDFEKAEELFRVIGTLSGIKFYSFDSEKMTQEAREALWRKAGDVRLEENRMNPERITAREKAAAKKEGMLRRALP